MLEELPDDLGDLTEVSVNSASGEPDALVILNGTTGAVMARMGGVPLGSPGYFLRADRARLRKYLAQNIPISFGKYFESFTTDNAGVNAFFSDGTSARGSLLVGADGAFSRVRQALLGKEHVSERSRLFTINGTLTLQREDFEAARKIANSLLLVVNKDCLLNIGVTAISSDGETADFYWGVGHPSEDPAAEAEWHRHADAEALLRRAADLTRNMPSYATAFISNTKPEGIKLPSIRFVEYMPPSSMPIDRRVTLLGDAAHTMIPYKGAGANTALQDSGDLGRLITKDLRKSNWDSNTVANALKQYHDILLPRGRKMVSDSHSAGQASDGIMAVTHGRVHENS